MHYIIVLDIDGAFFEFTVNENLLILTERVPYASGCEKRAEYIYVFVYNILYYNAHDIAVGIETEVSAPARVQYIVG